MATGGVILSFSRRARRAPKSPVFAVDWSHPLANGLLTIWLPATSTVPHLTDGGMAVFTQMSAARASLGQGTKYGAGNNRAAYYTIGSQSYMTQGFTAPHTVAYVGQFRAGGLGNSTVYGLRANQNDANPQFATGFDWASVAPNTFNATIGGGNTLGSTDGTAFVKVTSSSPTHVGDHVWVMAAVSGSQKYYLDGRLINSASVALGTPTLADPNIGFNNSPRRLNEAYENLSVNVAGAIWKRELTQNEIAEFSSSPFAFLRY